MPYQRRRSKLHSLSEISPSIIGQKAKSCRSLWLRDWTEHVWAEAEHLWIARDGQDSYYRDHVIIPGLAEFIVRLCGHDSFGIVDLGSGDAYCTQGLVSRLTLLGIDVFSLMLVDRSPVQMNIALSHPGFETAIPILADLQDQDWGLRIPPLQRPQVFVSVFVIQELPALALFLAELRRLMSKTDLAVLLTVAPTFSDLLKQRGEILNPVLGGQDDDWDWRGLYPIDGAAGRFYLPHFQRSVKIHNELFRTHGLRRGETRYLSVPTNDQSSSVFAKTVYGQSILGTRSSVIFALYPDR